MMVRRVLGKLRIRQSYNRKGEKAEFSRENVSKTMFWLHAVIALA